MIWVYFLLAWYGLGLLGGPLAVYIRCWQQLRSLRGWGISPMRLAFGAASVTVSSIRGSGLAWLYTGLFGVLAFPLMLKYSRGRL